MFMDVLFLRLWICVCLCVYVWERVGGRRRSEVVWVSGGMSESFNSRCEAAVQDDVSRAGMSWIFILACACEYVETQ